MKIRVEYTAQIKRAAGLRTEAFDLDDNATPLELLRAVADRHSALEQFVFDEHGQPQRTLLLFINDEQVHWPADVSIESGARVTLMTPISGG